jgi:signal transduction histidine kinase
MKVFANREIRNLFQAVLAVWAVALALTQGIVWHTTHAFSFGLLLVFLLLGGCLWSVLFRYFQRQSALLEQAVQQIQSCLDGNPDARLDCDREGELYRLFHSVNALAAVLSAHADNEQREKHFLKNTIADISHQLKTPLAALNIYNGLLQDEAVLPSEVKEFADLSEQELDRIETLVQNLLKITRLDAGSVVLEKKNENVAEMVQDIARQYHYRAEQEQKKLVLSGSAAVTLWCDRDWMQEAVDNLVKNAFDHTKSGDTIQVEWNALPSMVQIKVRDNGSGIHPEDLYHIFKRFYRSRFSQDTQGIGLGLPLAKAVVEAHHGTIEVDSELGKGTTFTLNFPIPTKL